MAFHPKRRKYWLILDLNEEIGLIREAIKYNGPGENDWRTRRLIRVINIRKRLYIKYPYLRKIK